jgi:outer membrane protein OmpA-like peptidoglycan-associated protein
VRLPPLTLLVLLAACVSPTAVRDSLDQAENTLTMAHRVYAPLCAPFELAHAESAAVFARIELHQGYIRRAQDHVAYADAMANAALAKATPCGGVDRDKDTIPDIVDRCPDEPEDLDGDRDDDGCRDVDPHGDEDKDGIVNIDDSCVDEPEDFDGHNDEDGCPETSDDSDGDGIVDVVDQCPTEPEDLDTYKDIDGCPDPDNDSDGIPDLRDACMMTAEDLDDWDDEDGCPDPDNDGDGIPDMHDKCPNVAGDRLRQGCPLADEDGDGVADLDDLCPTELETPNGYLDEDGCPDVAPSRVKVTQQRVMPKEHIKFKTGSAYLISDSYPLLDDIAQVLVDAPKMRLRIEGHTDSDGGEGANFSLSKSRAESVRTYLISRGVLDSRLAAEGFGETRPLDTNRTPLGRANNRRVEFHILQ